MRNETRVGVVVGLLVVVVTSVYFYGSSREDEDVLVGLGRRGGVQPGSLDSGASAPTVTPAVTPRPIVETPRTPPAATPNMFATGGPVAPPINRPVNPPPKPDESLLADAMRPRRGELPPLTPSPVPLRTGSSSALEDATRRNLEPAAAAPAAGGAADLDAISDRIRRAETTGANAGAAPISPPRTGLSAEPPAREPVDVDAFGDVTANAAVPSRIGWPKQHRVEYGETLYGISMQYYGRSSGTDAILKANPGLKGPRSLREGQTLVIPAFDGAAPVMASGAGNTTTPPRPAVATPGRNTYVVREGDSFYTIAKTMLNDGKRWEEIYEMNKALVKGSPKRLRPGMIIVLPARK